MYAIYSWQNSKSKVAIPIANNILRDRLPHLSTVPQKMASSTVSSSKNKVYV